MSLPTDAKLRKQIPVYSGCIDYFPDALAAVSRLSQIGNDQHNSGKHLHWDRSKSGDELDAAMRHMIDGDWEALAWRALAHLQKEIENGYVPKGFEAQPKPPKDDLPPWPMPFEDYAKSKGFTYWYSQSVWHTDTGFVSNAEMHKMYQEYLETHANANGGVSTVDES